MTVRYLIADVFDGLATLEAGTVDLVVTSPPFLALRSYLPADHPEKGKEIGSEATPAEFLDVMLKVTAELRRVLAPHGSIAIELGDVYAGSGGAGGDYGEGGWRGDQSKFAGSALMHRKSKVLVDGKRLQQGEGWPLAKSKTLIPELYRIALAYGFNPLTGQPSPAGQWRVRNVVTWCRPNPPVGALGDKWRPATSDVVVACLSGKRYWDDLATRKPYQHPDHSQLGKSSHGGKEATGDKDGNWHTFPNRQEHPSGAPLLDYWEIPPGGYKGSHYAVFPPELVVPLVKAMCPEKVCRTCGEPSRRMLTKQPTWHKQPELAAHIKERRKALGLKTVDIDNWFGYKDNANHWERTDQSGAGVPSAEDWLILKERLGLSDDFDSFIVDRRHSETEYYDQNGQPTGTARRIQGDYQGSGSHSKKDGGKTADRSEFGFTDCGHDDWRPGLVLDPFAGSGTTLMVAHGHGHDSVGIDLDERNLELARERVGPFFFEEVTV
jgi:DNA modification methylase